MLLLIYCRLPRMNLWGVDSKMIKSNVRPIPNSFCNRFEKELRNPTGHHCSNTQILSDSVLTRFLLNKTASTLHCSLSCNALFSLFSSLLSFFLLLCGLSDRVCSDLEQTWWLKHDFASMLYHEASFTGYTQNPCFV